MFKILSRREMAQGTVVENVIEAPQIAKKAKPGQFVILRVNETGERIPLTMANTDPERGTITLIYQIVGKTTSLMKTLQVGDALMDIAGPLGKPTHIDNIGTVVCIGGGTGVAVLHPITRGFKEMGNKVIGIIGARNKELLIMEDEMKAASTEFEVCTDDGSCGYHGFGTDLLKKRLESEKVDLVVGIGPVPMMKFVCSVTKQYDVPTLVSLNAIMVDGTGMCGCCRVSVGGDTKFACVDGPEFDGHKVDFDGLSQRLAGYMAEEKVSMDRFTASCNCSCKE
ncbi:sulfide dehydrogenase (flavoprotein) subunit SudB [Desulfatibacillum alkenivorans DSM 16219]|jgi:ferredoxin--NADP+ reductase|uniref:Sulfide dehydrogenase (Flavoprotein) subunit SudB n=1 Tax=Desulfatibacillum alkenivorans DSM 16219 TaxID=1121393 RepID=A0A1M6KJS5_9BACT|nr:sulfide/dihydroorotate dehydrogenase-like FAD/NAD-binding protein [Desulfatibacillum alkenivorans]SHJ59159.1 sulfide dehydrogenase (flavoprotein) subunit SudB [Desulfatibacillum alkenivorans DSM 16219]